MHRRSNVFYLLSLAPDQLFLLAMLSRDGNFGLNGNQVLKNLAHMADRQRIMSFVLNESRFAIRETVRDCFRQPNGESAIFYSMPESHRHGYILARQSSWRRTTRC